MDRPKEKQLVFEIGRGFERRHDVVTSSAPITNTTINTCFKILTNYPQVNILYEM
jgi:hypothetical protein